MFSRIRSDQSVKLFSIGIASVSGNLVCSNEAKSEQGTSPSRKHDIYKKLNTKDKILYNLFGKALPEPRILDGKDKVFDTYQVRKGLKDRRADEKKLETIQKQIMECVQANDRKCIESQMQNVNEVLYGKGTTMQDREEFLIKYGCTPYSDEILDKILSFDRPIMDIGAGNGQWARALSERAKKNAADKGAKMINDYVVAYDNGSAIPLNTEIYHKLTKPAQEHFYNVEKMDGVDAVRQIKNRGRILLLVYPSPGPMAYDVVKSYSEFKENDLVVFVGEGVDGGANGNADFLEFFKSKHWVLLQTMDVPSVKGGGKGLEKVFIFKKALE